MAITFESKQFSFKYQKNKYYGITSTILGGAILLITDAFSFSLIDLFTYNNNELKYNTDDVNVLELIIGSILFFISIFCFIYRKKIERFSQEKFIKSLLVIKHQGLGSISNINLKKRVAGRNYKFYNINTLTIDEIPFDKSNNYQRAVENQQQLITDYKTLIEESHEVAYFGLSRIPLTFLLGNVIGNNSNIRVFDFDRKKSSWTQISHSWYNNILKSRSKLESDNGKVLNKNSKDLILTTSISYSINIDDTLNVIETPYKIINLKINNFINGKTDRLKSRKETIKLKLEFKKILDEISEKYNNINTIHFFYSGPNSLAFLFGSVYSKSIHKNILVYNYNVNDSPKYSWNISINDFKLSKFKTEC
ncbi:putative SAVED domain-containing protein [Tenacibaculum sp. 190524A02b]|uniref:SAVED domain-containing protein n=1 Tax=Tenacibaculum vairaonense TaxID=3137860 RepID=A0ABP1F539_9FLAO